MICSSATSSDGVCRLPQGLFGPLPDWFTTLKLGDWTLHVLNAQHGWIGYIDEVWAVYRQHGRSGWSQTGEIDRILGFMDAVTTVDQHLGYAYHSHALATLRSQSCHVALVAFDERDPRARRLANSCARYSLEVRPRHLRDAARVVYLNYVPRAARLLARVKNWLR